MTQTVKEYSEEFPFEIRAGIEGIDGETEQAIMVLLMNEGALAFSEIKEMLSDSDEDLHPTTLSNALESLKDGGLINKRVDEADPESGLSSYYSVSEYGHRFVNSLFDSLGRADGLKGRNMPILGTSNNLFESTEQVSAEIGKEMSSL